jgi:hypothetical protein
MTPLGQTERVLLLPDGRTSLRKVDWQQALSDALMSVDVATNDVIEDFWKYVTDPAYDLDENP